MKLILGLPGYDFKFLFPSALGHWRQANKVEELMKTFASKVLNSTLTLLASKVFYNRLAYWILRCALDDKGKSLYSYGAVP